MKRRFQRLQEYVRTVEIRIEIPEHMVKKIDRLVDKGYFISRKAFIKAAIAEALVRYRVKQISGSSNDP